MQLLATLLALIAAAAPLGPRGRTWWETFLGELVVAVVPGPRRGLLAYVQQQLDPNSIGSAVTWQYVSRDGGHHWVYSAALGGL